MRLKRFSILLLDDNADLCRLYKLHIERAGPFVVTVETEGLKARQLAERQLFDLVVIDAKLDYRGHEFGGLRLADDLSSRYGVNSVLVISRFITAELLRAYGTSYEFMEKSGDNNTRHFCEALCRRLIAMRRKQYVFVAMPFASDYLKRYKRGIKPAIQQAGYECIRVDEVQHNRRIHDVIFELVQKAKLVVFAADGANPNAYYEAGFADAMKKEVVIVAASSSELKFDISNRNTIFYGDDDAMLSKRLKSKLDAVRLSEPIGI